MLMIECGRRCPLGNHCANQRFQNQSYAKVEPFKTLRKGWGLRSQQPIEPGKFIVEYVGEVIDPEDFKERVDKYSNNNHQHYYFMALKNDEIIDATIKASVSRFVNHSCDPNAEIQKWTVKGDLRIGFFAKRYIERGEEITCDYQFQRYGKELQKCYCESPQCRGVIGTTEVTISTDGSRIIPKSTQSELGQYADKHKREDEFEDIALEEEIEKLLVGGGIRNRQQTLTIARLMVRAEDSSSRMKLLEVIKGTQEVAYLRLLLDYHGLQLLWSWMAELDDVYLKAKILEMLEILPIPNKTMLKDSKVLEIVEKWSKETGTHSESEKTAQKPTSPSISELPSKSGQEEGTPLVGEVTLSERDEPINEREVLDENSIAAPPESLSQESLGFQRESFPSESQESEVEVNNSKIEENVDGKTSEELESGVVSEQGTKKLTDEEVEESENKKLKEENLGKVEVKNEESKENDLNRKEENEIPGTENGIEKRIFPIVKSNAVIQGKENKRIVIVKVERRNNQNVAEKAKEVKPSKPNIAVLAIKLLNLWKDLKEVFRIPRLERQKRHGDEKEADRRTRELEERRSKGLPIVYDKNKRGIDDRDNTIAGILGIRRKANKRPSNDDAKRPTFTSTNIQQNNDSPTITPTPPKINKENHRMQFEIDLMRKQYEEALRGYQKQMMDYNAMLLNQQIYPNAVPPPPVPGPPPTVPLIGSQVNDNQQQEEQQQQQPSEPQQPRTPPNVPCYEEDANLYDNNTTRAYPIECLPVPPPSEQFYDSSISNSFDIPARDHQHHHPGYMVVNEAVEEVYNYEEELISLEPASMPVNVECTSKEHTVQTDEKAVISADYGIKYVPVEKGEEFLIEDFFNPVYPPPGSYFFTPEGERYFVPAPFDHSGEPIASITFRRFNDPFSSNFICGDVLTALPRNWNSLRTKKGEIYYYHKRNLRVQWDVPVEEMRPICVQSVSKDDNIVISKADSTSTPKVENESSLQVNKSPLEVHTEMNGGLESGDSTECSGTPVSSLPGAPLYEPDPRKRKYLENAVAQILSSVVASAENTSYHRPSRHKSESKSERKIKDKFKTEMSEHIKNCLNPYRRLDSKVGRILCNEDFKFLARKLTHFVMVKEIKHCRSIEDLSCNDAVKHKAKDYVKKYMAKQGSIYRPESAEEKEDQKPPSLVEATIMENSTDAS